MSLFKRNIPLNISYWVYVYLSGIIIFTFLRVIFLITHQELAQGIPLAILLQAFFMGFRFDTVISGYFLLIPFFITSIFSFFTDSKQMYRVSNFYLLLVYPIAFFMCASDIPYFAQFNSHLTIAALNWVDSPVFMFKLMFTDAIHYLYLSLFIVVVCLFYFHLKRIRINIGKAKQSSKLWTKILGFIVGLGLLILGIRGRIEEKSPIRWGTAFFSKYTFANQLGLNPVFTFGRTALDNTSEKNQKLQFMNDDDALIIVQKELNISPDNQFESPIARKVVHPQSRRKYNVVLVLMESMSAKYLKQYGNTKGLTPVLDSLSTHSYSFDNFFAAGIHTFNGVYSSLYGMPALLNKHPMKGFDNVNHQTGIANELIKQNYQTLFFCTHDEQFDNMGGFLTANGVQQIISEKDFPKEMVLSTLGVPDHILFDKVIPTLNSTYKKGSPFFATILTASNHTPIFFPEDIPFQFVGNNDMEQIVSYADWSIGQFMEQASQQDWFDSTLFLFTGDHGRPIKPIYYDITLSYHHIPFIIYAPEIITTPQNIEHFGGQIDIYPTLMGLLNVDFINYTLGINLIQQKRNYFSFSSDDKWACINDSMLFIGRSNGIYSLHKYQDGDLTDYTEEYPHISQTMRKYGEANLQAAQWILAH